MRILVTGYDGFIGKNVAQYLQTQGHEVGAWDWKPSMLPSRPYSKFKRQVKDNNVINLFEGRENYKQDFVSVEDFFVFMKNV